MILHNSRTLRRPEAGGELFLWVITPLQVLPFPADRGNPIPPCKSKLSLLALAARTHRSSASKVAKGDKVVTLEAMKMQTTIYAHADGVVAELQVAVGDSVEAGDLLVKLRS